ncbi:MAG: molecular chaperone HtpG, partial [Clostridiales bacterium]|nr:molecular chaperone HtpG [Clostridiales bacterium]
DKKGGDKITADNTDDKDNDNADKTDADREERDGAKINKTPLWVKTPKDCAADEYREFYREMFFDFKEPLFWIHLNVDYPFNLKGILYFPDADLRNVRNEGAIKLFNNQVYVADNIKDVIPEYLMLLKGCIDCPDMPLNVSRSFLQNDGYLAKIKAHITKKVAEKLKSLYASEPDDYKKYWKTLNPFVKYGCMTDKDFYGKIKEAVIFKTAAPGEYISLDEVLREKTVYYVDDKDTMSLYLEGFKDKKVLLLDDLIDVHFIQFLEGENRDVKFARADSDADAFKAEDAAAADPKLAEGLFKRVLPDVNAQAGPLSADVPCLLISGEQARRMEAMGRMYNYGADMPSFKDEKLFINTAHAAVKRLIETPDDGAVRLLYGAARLANGSLKPEEAGELAKGIYAAIGK